MSKSMQTSQESSCSEAFEPWEYWGSVVTANENHQDNIRQALRGFELDLPTGVAVVTVGSDGKLERFAQSMTELVLISDNAKESALRERLGKYCKVSVPDMDFEFAYDGLPGFFALDNEVPFSFVYGDHRLIYPDFLLNSSLLVGDPVVWVQARQRVLDEQLDQRTGQGIRRAVRKQLTHHRQIMRNGADAKTTHWSFADAVQYYDESSSVYGFKMGPIRAVQRKLDLLTLAALPLKAEDLPTSTVERVAFFVREGRVTSELGEAVSVSYLWFLQRYHQAQMVYKDARQPVSQPFCQEDFKSNSAAIWEFIG